ncbi:MAG TPA: class I SAM-dependent methyltransferase [Pseudolabrys sp.]|nr:class I SAM-dependent methyltransferase [Pseudolabrys sp.]
MISQGSAVSDTVCAVCGQRSIVTVARFAALPRVSSDCRPFPSGGQLGVCAQCGTIQKPDDATWRSEALSIYQRYDMFRQSAERAEQAVFQNDAGAPVRRSALVLKKLLDLHPLNKQGRILDVGCGNGPTLRALADLMPEAELYGHEISDATLPSLVVIPGFRKLYTGEVGDIQDRFDLIILSQSLEHVIDPVDTLATLRTKLATDGVLLIQVPNGRLNVFDLLVADHRSHFDPGTLAQTARRAGFKHVAVSEWVYKELSMTVSDAPLAFSSMPEPPRMTVDGLNLRIDWLSDVIEKARTLADKSPSFGIFGSSIAGTWLLGALKDRVSFFVDEDTTRVGQKHEGIPILAPSQVPAGACVFIPLVPQMAQGIADRLGGRGFEVHIPAPQTGF